MRDIAANGEPISVQGQRAAEQPPCTRLTLRGLQAERHRGNERELRAAIDSFPTARHPPLTMLPASPLMQKVSALLPRPKP